MNHHRWLFSWISCVLFATQAYCQNIIVNWTGDTVGSTTPFNGWNSQVVYGNNGTYNANPASRTGRLGALNVDNISTDAIVGIPFSQTTPLSPAAGYTGQRFFGGAMANIITPGATVPTIDDLRIRNPGDYLDFRFQLSSKLHDSRIAIFFDKSDFLVGNTPGQYVQFGPTSSLTVKVGNSSSSQVNNDGELRWIVREGGQWWISAANAQGDPNVKSAQGGGTNPIQNGNLLTTTAASGELRYWAPYDPLTGGGLINMNWEPTYTSRFVIANPGTVFTRDTNSSPFLNIDAIGFYIEGDQLATNVFQFEIDTINFNMQLAVPEPATYVMLGLMGAGYFACRNLRRRNPAADPENSEEKTESADPVPAIAAV